MENPVKPTQAYKRGRRRTKPPRKKTKNRPGFSRYQQDQMRNIPVSKTKPNGGGTIRAPGSNGPPKKGVIN